MTRASSLHHRERERERKGFSSNCQSSKLQLTIAAPSLAAPSLAFTDARPTDPLDTPPPSQNSDFPNKEAFRSS